MAEMDVMRRVTHWLYDSANERAWMQREMHWMKSHGISAEVREKNYKKRVYIGLFRDRMTGVEKENTIVWTSHRRNT